MWSSVLSCKVPVTLSWWSQNQHSPLHPRSTPLHPRSTPLRPRSTPLHPRYSNNTRSNRPPFAQVFSSLSFYGHHNFLVAHPPGVVSLQYPICFPHLSHSLSIGDKLSTIRTQSRFLSLLSLSSTTFEVSSANPDSLLYLHERSWNCPQMSYFNCLNVQGICQTQMLKTAVSAFPKPPLHTLVTKTDGPCLSWPPG